MNLTKFGVIPSQSNFWLEGWSYGKEISISADDIDADLEYFPLTVYLRDVDTVPIDLCVGGTALSGGDGGGNNKTNAFDESTTTYWASSQVPPNVSGTSYIGYQFISEKKVQQIRYRSGADDRNLSSIKIQYSDNGSSWSDAYTTSGLPTANAWNIINISDNGSHIYWRLFANSNNSGTGAWFVYELEMCESPMYANFDFSKAKADGSDIRFTDINLSQLKFECKEYGTALAYDTTDLCTGGTPLVSSSYSSSYDGSKLVDDSESTYWRCNTTGAGSYMGYQFANTQQICQIKYMNYGTTSYNPTAVKVEYSDNGTSWIQAGTNFTTTSTANAWQTLNIPNVGTHIYWRVTSVTLGSYGWRVYELQMFEPTSQIAVYNIQIPSIKNLTDTKIYMWYGNNDAYNTSIEAWQDMTGKTITYNGTAALKSYSNSAKFNGSGNVLTLADSTDWYLDTGDFTIEVFVRMSSLPASTKSYAFVSSYEVGGANYWTCYLYNSGTAYTLGIDDYISSVKQNSGASATWTSPAVDTEYHIAYCRSGNTMRYFVNGTQVDGDKTWTWSLADAAGLLYIGGRTDTSNVFSGYMRGVRVTKGTARYTTTFTPPTYFIKDTNTVLCMNMQELEGTTTFYDACGKTVTTVGTVTATRTGEPKRALVIDGTDSNYFSLVDSDDWTISTNDFTMEFILYHKTLPASGDSQHLWSQYVDGSNYIRFNIYYDTGVAYMNYGGTTTGGIKGILNYSLGVPFHIAVSRTSGVTKIFANGVQCGTDITDTADYPNLAAIVQIGAHSNANTFDGQMRGCRFTNGIGRYTTTFTPPISFNIDSVNVKFCSNFETIYDNNFLMVQHLGDTLTDASGNKNNGTATGTTVVNTDYGRVRSFNGSSDKVVFPATSLLADSADFTLLGLLYPTNLTSKTFFIHKRDTASANKYLHLGIAASTDTYPYSAKLGFWSDDAVNTTTHLLNTYYIICGRYINSTKEQKLFEDGISTATRTATAALNSTNDNELIIGYDNSSIYNQGYYGEIKTSNIARSDAWIKAESLAIKNNLITIIDLT